MSIENVKVKYIRPKGYNNLKEWVKDTKNEYIGRAGIVFIDGERYPKRSSPFHNPFKIGKDGDRDEVINKYRSYIIDNIGKNEILMKQLISMKGKRLGCWCYPDACHGDVLLELIDMYTKPSTTQPSTTKPSTTQPSIIKDKSANIQYIPYKYTKEDKEWRINGGKTGRKWTRTEKQMCERHTKNVFTKGTNDQYEGCGDGWCCTLK
jgi:hypothetical protein